MCLGDLAGGETGQGYLARQDHSYINVPWRRREAATSSKQHRAQAECDCLILSGNTTSHTLLPKPQAWAGTACSLSVRLAGGGEAKTAQPRLSSRQSPYWVWGRAVPQQRHTSAAGFSKCSSSESELSCAGSSGPTGMLQPSTNQRAKSHCHSLLPTS